MSPRPVRDQIASAARAPARSAQQATEAVLAGFRKFFTRARELEGGRVLGILRQRYPTQQDDVLKRMVREEQQREQAFEAKVYARLRRDLPEAFAIADPRARAARLNEIVDREQRYVNMRLDALADRSMQALERYSLMQASPDGAYWTLSPDVQNHTPDCVALAGNFWPWPVLKSLHPPLHPGCACHLLGKNEAISAGLMTEDDVPSSNARAIVRARGLYGKGKALEQSLASGEWAAFWSIEESARPEVEESIREFLRESWDEAKHPRDRLGRWIRVGDKVRSLDREGVGEVTGHVDRETVRVRWPEGELNAHSRSLERLDRPGELRPTHEHPEVRPTAVGDEYAATGPEGEFIVRPTEREARAAAHEIERAESDRVTDVRDFPSEPFRRDPSEVETARQLVLSGRPTTRDEFARTVDGKLVYSVEREKLHRKIIDSMLKDVPSQKHPQVFFTGGGYAAGKGGVLKLNPHGWLPKNAIVIDPDKVKAQLPEYMRLLKEGDPEANLRVYEEAWDVSQALVAEAQRRKVNVVADGVGNFDAQQVIRRAQSYIDAGYGTPHAVYVTKPTQEALNDAQGRLLHALNDGKWESARYIPPDLLWDTHARVSAVFPDILAAFPGDIELFRTFGFDPKLGGFPPVIRILSKYDGKLTTDRPDLYDEFLAKGMDAPQLNEATDEYPAPVYVPWEIPSPIPLDYADGDVAEAAWDPVKHPRDRHGRFSEVEKLAKAAQRGTLVDGVHDGPSAAVALAHLGVEGSFGTSHFAPGVYKQIVSAVGDAIDRYPVLKTGGHPLRAVRMVSGESDEALPDSVREGMSDTWAMTHRTPDDAPVKGTYIFLNDKLPEDSPFDVEGPGIEMIYMGMLAPSDASIYGRMMHELGHAVAFASGFDEARPFVTNLRYEGILHAADFMPRAARALSAYAAASAPEAWGEIFASINAPPPRGLELPQWMAQTLDTVAAIAAVRNEGMGPARVVPGSEGPNRTLVDKYVRERREGNVALAWGPVSMAAAMRRAEANVAANSWGAALSEALFDPVKHPRDRHGRFSEVEGLAKAAQRGTLKLPDVARTPEELKAFAKEAARTGRGALFRTGRGVAELIHITAAHERGFDYRPRGYEGVPYGYAYGFGRLGPGDAELRWAPDTSIRYDSDVLKINSATDAENYLKSKLGIEAAFQPLPDVVRGVEQVTAMSAGTLSTGSLRQIAQAVTDAMRRYPVLKDGEHPLGGVATDYSIPSKDRAMSRGFPWVTSGVWATTGPDPRSGKLAWGSRDSADRGPGGAKTWIMLNDFNPDLNSGHLKAADDGTLSWAAGDSVYGRMMHELGHAVLAAVGGQSDQLMSSGAPAGGAEEILTEHNIIPLDITTISRYGASNANEAWAEVFTTKNTPGAIDMVSSSGQRIVRELTGSHPLASVGRHAPPGTRAKPLSDAVVMLVTGGPLLDAALRQADANIAAGRWDAPVDEVAEAGFDPLKHPHDRRGRWEHTEHDVIDRIDHDVKSYIAPDDVKDADTAERFMAQLGVEAHLHSESLRPITPEFYQSLAHAYEYAFMKYPTLRSGAHPLKRVVFVSAIRGTAEPALRDGLDAVDAHDGTWAVTGGNPVTMILNDMLDDGAMEFLGDDIAPAHDGWASPAEATVYGRTLHELGHAVAKSVQADAPMANQIMGKMSPVELAHLSRYAAMSPYEAFAEAFATWNQAHVFNGLTSQQQAPVNEIRALARGVGLATIAA